MSWKRAVRYLLQYQCQLLTSKIGDPAREYSSTYSAETLELDPEHDQLFMLTIGGVPAATAVVAGTMDTVGRWYIGHICSHTRTGAGAMLLQHLQSLAAAEGIPGLSLSAFGPENIRVYKARGFLSDPAHPDGREMFWDV